jgi:hypothetical protein
MLTTNKKKNGDGARYSVRHFCSYSSTYLFFPQPKDKAACHDSFSCYFSPLFIIRNSGHQRVVARTVRMVLIDNIIVTQ